MVFEGLRSYVQLASGLTEVTRQRALAAARSLAASGESGLDAVLRDDLVDQVSGIAEELVATSKANRDLLLGVIRSEVERQVARLGLVGAADYQAVRARAERLELRVRDLEDQLAERPSPAPSPSRERRSAPARPAPGRTPAPPRAAEEIAGGSKRAVSRQTREEIVRAREETVQRVASQKAAVKKVAGRVPERKSRRSAAAQGDNPSGTAAPDATGPAETGPAKTGSPKTGSPKTGSPKTGSPKTGSPKTGAERPKAEGKPEANRPRAPRKAETAQRTAAQTTAAAAESADVTTDAPGPRRAGQ